MTREITPDQEIWVMTAEGAELTGYNRQYVEKLAKKIGECQKMNALLKRDSAQGAMKCGCQTYSTILTKSVTGRIKINNNCKTNAL